MLVNLIESVYRLLWGDLFTIPLGGGIGIVVGFIAAFLYENEFTAAPVFCRCGCSGI